MSGRYHAADSSWSIFNTAVKEVDMGGEMLTYQNLTRITDFAQNELPPLITAMVAEQSQLPPQVNAMLKERLDLIWKMLDLNAFKAVAASSVEIAPDLFVAKNIASGMDPYFKKK